MVVSQDVDVNEAIKKTNGVEAKVTAGTHTYSHPF